ncbi:MAG TPA: phenylalanine--tRNA ligase subunit beta, partial [Candidatus Methylomirabilis sp.]|nr:phenylalanine--tRNA ligase subunit beta [Candidatus Methylomirabilis sp.]
GEEHGATVYEMDLTTNRVDAMNHYGVAREASAIYGVELKPFQPKLPAVERGPSTSLPAVAPLRMTQGEFPIVIDDAEGCARYTARIVRGVKIGPSPEHIAKRLELLGSRAINNAADATNYAINELGHPTHAFDLDLLEGGTIIVRRAKDGEFLKTLDGVGHTLTSDDLVIADAEKPVALAGVMGGFDSMITEKTKNVLIESAWFDPATVRSMAKRHGMHTDASHRFERGADWGVTPTACDRVAELILETAGGELVGECIDAVARTVQPPTIALRRTEVKRILGIEISDREIGNILGKLGFVATRSGGEFSVVIPTWRLDVEREIDLLEELARIYGYNKFPNTLPPFVGAVRELPNEARDARVRQTMLSLGYDEAISITFISAEDAKTFGSGTPLFLANPLSEEAGTMRSSLVPGLLNMVGYNLNRGTSDVRLFEAGEVFENLGVRHEEHRRLAFAATGSLAPHSVHCGAEAVTFYHIKGDVEQLLAAFEYKSLYFDDKTPEYYHPGRSARAVLDGETVARFGQLHPEVAAARKLRQDVFLAEVMLDRLYKRPLREPKYRRFSKFPAVGRDFSFSFDDAVTFERVRSAVEALGIAEMQSFAPVEIYRGDKVGAGRYSTLLHAEFQSQKRTLRDDEVAQWSAQIVKALEGRGGALRS